MARGLPEERVMSALVDSPPTWLAARAKNAIRRPVFLGGLSVGVFVTTLVAFVVMPQQQRRRAAAAPVRAASIPVDTQSLREAVSLSSKRVAAADSALEVDRARILAAASTARPAADTIDPRQVAIRDSIATLISDLQGLITTAETAPLPSSYLALAASPAFVDKNRVRALSDSLIDIERERDALSAAGGGDPIFVALTSRLTDIGHAIRSQAEARREELRVQAGQIAVTPARRVAAQIPRADTAQWVAERDSARAALRLATDALDEVRARNAGALQEAERGRAAAQWIAPPVALLGASIVFGVLVGFLVAFLDEMRRPRVSDADDAERATGLRSLASIRPRAPVAERRRRAADRVIPGYIDPAAETYQGTYLHLSRSRARHLLVTVVAEDPIIAALVATNLAAIAADEARAPLVIDATAPSSPVASVLGITARAGLSDIVSGRSEWADSTVIATLGRGRQIAVVPSGRDAVESGALCGAVRRDAERLIRHYDAIIVATTPPHACAGLAAALPITDTILCVRAAHTFTRDLVAYTEALHLTGATIIGLVVWDTELPPRHASGATRATSRAAGAPERALAGA
jgi:Mrp family chromosome partitioning ATPase